MPEFVVENLTDNTIRLGIEPWADVEDLRPDGKVEFEYDEPAEIAFSLISDGSACVSIVSTRIKVSANGGEKTFRPPKGDW